MTQTTSVEEQLRLATLRSYNILDTPPEEMFDQITASIAEICKVPISLLTLVDRDRQWFKSTVGLPVDQTDRQVSFCSHAIQQEDLMVVQNALEDERFADNSLVTGDPNIRFYAGMPLITPEGQGLGTLCVIDRVPRQLTQAQEEAIRRLGRSAMRILDLRRKHGTAVLAKAADLSSTGITIADASLPGLPLIFTNQSFCEMTGYKFHEIIGQPYSFNVDTVTSAETGKALEASIAEKRPLTADVSCCSKSGQALWTRLSAIPFLDSDSTLLYVVCIYEDITAQKRVEIQQQQLLAMRTTMATVNDIVFNFMNTLNIYRMQMESDWNVPSEIIHEFDSVFRDTVTKLSAINGLTEYRQRATSLGFNVLDTGSPKPSAD